MEQYITLASVMDKLQRHPLMAGTQYEALVDYAVDFLSIAGSPDIFADKETEIPISNYRGKLPCDWVETNQVVYCGKAMTYTTSTFMPQEGDPLTFKIQNNIIYTSIKEGVVQLSYKAILTDDDGFPLIPADPTFTNALEWYVKLQVFTILFDLGRLPSQVYSNAQTEYCWAVGRMKTACRRLDLSRLEAVSNSWHTMLQKTNEFQKQFRDNGQPLEPKVH